MVLAVEFAFVALGVALILVLYVFGAYSYSIAEGELVIRWRVLGMPFGSRRIPVGQIEELRRFDWKSDLFPGFEIWGRLLRGHAWVIVRRTGLLRKIYVTPPDPEALEEAMEIHRRERKR